MLNIYEYFNSKDIAEHCQSINHNFSPLDKAVLISLSNRPLSERLAAYKELAKEAGSFEIKNPFDETKEMSKMMLGDFLAQVIAGEEEIGEKFREQGDEFYYEIVFEYVDDSMEMGKCTETNILCRYQEVNDLVVQRMKVQEEDEERLDRVIINKRRKSLVEEDIAWGYEVISMECFPEVERREVKIEEGDEIISEESIRHHFIVYVPTPFKPGDILQFRNNAIIVFEDIIDLGGPDAPTWPLETCDMLAYNYYVSEDFYSDENPIVDWQEGTLRANSCSPHTELTHYRKPLTWKQLPLLFASRFVKKEIHDLQLLSYMDIYRSMSHLMNDFDFYYDDTEAEMFELFQTWFGSFIKRHNAICEDIRERQKSYAKAKVSMNDVVCD